MIILLPFLFAIGSALPDFYYTLSVGVNVTAFTSQDGVMYYGGRHLFARKNVDFFRHDITENRTVLLYSWRTQTNTFPTAMVVYNSLLIVGWDNGDVDSFRQSLRSLSHNSGLTNGCIDFLFVSRRDAVSAGIKRNVISRVIQHFRVTVV